MVLSVAGGGCREHVNRLPENAHLLARLALVEGDAPFPVASLGSTMNDNSSPFADPYNPPDTSVSMSEAVMLDVLERATPPRQVQRWFADAFSQALLDNFRDIKLVGEDACDARLLVEITSYGVFAATSQSTPELQITVTGRMVSCEGENGLWQFTFTKAEALPRSVARLGFALPQSNAGPSLVDEDVAYIVERLATGAAVKLAQQMRDDAAGL